MKRLTIAATALIALGVAGAAISASHADPAIAKAVKARQSVMTLYSFNLGQLGAMAKGEVPYDAAVAQGAADNLAALSSMDHSAMWPAGSDNASFEGSRALPAMWEDMAGVVKTATMLSDASAKLAEVAGTDQAALGAALGGVGGACGACHKAYRAPN